MTNNPMTINKIKRIFDNDKWDERVKILQKPINFTMRELTGPYFRSRFLNFNYVDVKYKYALLESLETVCFQSQLYYWDGPSTTSSINYMMSDNLSAHYFTTGNAELIELIEKKFNELCKLIISNDFDLRKLNPNSSLIKAIKDEGDGCISLFYIFMSLFMNRKNENLVINNVELSMHPLALRQLKLYIEENFNFKVIFLMTRYDLFQQYSGIENLYVINNDGDIKNIGSFDSIKNKSKEKQICLNLQKMLMDGKFGDEWKVD